MTPDLIAQMRQLLADDDDLTWLTVHCDDLADLLDITDAAVVFGLACIELDAARAGIDERGGLERAIAANKAHAIAGKRFDALAIPKEEDRG